MTSGEQMGGVIREHHAGGGEGAAFDAISRELAAGDPRLDRGLLRGA